MNIKNLFQSFSLASLVGMLCISLALAPMIGCAKQQTISALVLTLGSTVSAVEAIQGNTAASLLITQDTQLAANQINAWVPGTPTQNVLQALNLVLTDIKAVPVPVSPTDQALIALGVSTAQQLIADFSTPSVKVALGSKASVNNQLKALVITDAEIKKLHEDFTAQAKAIISHDPSRASIPVK